MMSYESGDYDGLNDDDCDGDDYRYDDDDYCDDFVHDHEILYALNYCYYVY
jgi:hypothetical protein